MARARRSFQVESLERRSLLTSLAGTFTGKFNKVVMPPKFGLTAQVAGTAELVAMGKFRVVGFVDHPAPSGQTSGGLLFSNANGRFVLELSSSTRAGEIPGQLHFSVLVGTGAYQGLTGQGTLMVNSGAGIAASVPAGALGMETPTGVEGTIVAGPSSPGASQNVVPLAGATIEVEPAAGGQVIAAAQSDAQGHFALDLAPGTYLVVALPLAPTAFFPRPPAPRQVTIVAGEMTNLTFVCDTGIR